ncbi:MAG: hypothetical protein ACM3JD_04340, partial [Rudaea sp.]
MVFTLALVLLAGALAAVTFYPRQEARARRERQIDLAVLLLIGGGTIGFFWRMILVRDVWMPAGGGDLANFLYPTYHFAAEWWRRGIAPLWNPYLLGGQPFVGDIQSGIFYPINLLTFLLSNPLTYVDMEMLSVLHFFIAGTGMYALLRWGRIGAATGLSRPASLGGAIAFEFSDLFVTHFGNLNLIASASWLPLVLLFFSRSLDSLQHPSGPGHLPGAGFLRKRVLFPALASSLLLAVSFLAGHIQAFVFVLLALALYAVYEAWICRPDSLQILILSFVIVALGLGLSALVLLPAIEMARASVRSVLSYENAVQFSLPPAELVGLVVPGFFGRGAEAAWGPWDRVEVGYLGVLPLMLAGLAIALRRDRPTWFFSILSLAGLVLALGGYAIIHGWLYALAPGMGQLRAPARFIFLLDFGFAILAALGLDLLYRELSGVTERRLEALLRFSPFFWLVLVLIAGGGALAILILGQGQDPALYRRIAAATNAVWFFLLLFTLSLGVLIVRARRLVTPPVWAALALGLIAFDLFSLGSNFDAGLSDPTASYNRQDAVDFLQSDGDSFRVDSRGTGVEGAWLPDTALLYGLSDVNGDNPLTLLGFQRYWEAVGSRDSTAYARLNVKYVLARRSTPLPANFTRVFDGASGVSVYRNTNWVPGARIVFETCAVASLSDAFAAVRDLQYDPAKVVILEQAGAGCSGAASGTGRAEITGYGPNEIDVSVDDGGKRILVLSET